MPRCRWWFPLVPAVLTGAVGCGDDETSSPENQGYPTAVIDIVVDANRDGRVDPNDPGDQDVEDDWNETTGASFLANLDDDDGDHVRDADDEVVNGAEDEDDLAPIVMSAWPDAPEGATGVFSIDALSAESVRVWKKGLDGAWALIAGSLGPCDSSTAPCQFISQATLSTEEVRAGLTLGIEGRNFRLSDDAGAWTGIVDLSYTIRDKNQVPITSAKNPDGVDRAKIRIAPWMMFGNLSSFDTAWSDAYDEGFVAGLAAPLDEAGLTYNQITNYDDQWVQDYFQTGWTSIPGPDGTVRGMRVANARPWSHVAQPPYEWLKESFLAPDRAIFAIYKEYNTGDTYDSHGNHDLLPPYTNGAESYPLGRILHGSGILPETKEFYAAQGVQAPAVVVDTSWLLVGHVDEVFSYVPAKTPRGWKLLVGSPRLARQMLEQASVDGFGAVKMFVGKKWYPIGHADISIDAVLADPDIMAESQEAQTQIDGMLDIVRQAVGLTDSEIIEIPYLFHSEFGGLVAYNPGTANLLAFGDTVIHADPFGPVVNGADLFKKDLVDRLGTPVNALGSTGQGLHVFFADDWDTYHVLDGEVHCGSNVDAPPPADATWWEVSR